MSLTLRKLWAALLIAGVLCAATIWWQHTVPLHSLPPVYAALGASDAVGVGTEHPAEEGWVPRVYAKLPPSASLLNVGISGATLRDVLTEEVPPALDAHPHWVSIWPGINDLRDGVPLPTFAAQLDELLAHWSVSPTAPTSSQPIVVVLNIPDLRPVPAFRSVAPTTLDATVRAWNQTIAAAAGKHGARLVDLYSHGEDLLAHPGYLSGDGFHPSSAGYARIADLVLNVLESHAAPNVQ
ncbi:MAG: SGNH/GDSL hydrolase family protein [Herpetosiphonaceae bacterium]|nr:SGNH/GDSL hydrolase family protein [Herpetosiphonaceae bacterium]